MEIPRDAWAFFGVLLAFKLFTFGLIIAAMPGVESVGLLLAHSLPLFVAILLAIIAPAAFWFRMLRARAKRKRLLRAEFHVD